jgi:hypothetical protein
MPVLWRVCGKEGYCSQMVVAKMSSERYENVKKYMCKWLPEDALSGCKSRQKGIEPDDIACLVCLATTLESSCELLWKAIVHLGVPDPKLAGKLSDFADSFARTRLTFWQVARRLIPEFDKDKREEYTNIMEEMIERAKNE